MKQADAERVAKAVVDVDGQCSVCAGRCFWDLQRIIPECDWEAAGQKAGWNHTFADMKEEGFIT